MNNLNFPWDNPNFKARMKIREIMKNSYRLWLEQHDWHEKDCPILVKEPLESKLSFRVNYFNTDAYVSHNSQLYLEAQALIFHENSWTENPSFRSEKMESNRHLCEFSLLQLEELNVGLDEIIRTMEKFVKDLVEVLIEKVPNELRQLNPELKNLQDIQTPFEIMTYENAIEKLRSLDVYYFENNKKRPIEWGDDFNETAERYLTEEKIQPLFITHFPKNLRPFYIKQHDDGEKSISMDLLAPKGFGEISSGGVREDRHDVLVNELRNREKNVSNFEWYIDLKKGIDFSHGGFGIGIDRLIRWIADTQSVKDVVPFPRTMTTMTP